MNPHEQSDALPLPGGNDRPMVCVGHMAFDRARRDDGTSKPWQRE